MTTLRRLQEQHVPAYDAYTTSPAAACWVYEVWDEDRRLAYVGIADDFDRRWQQHIAKSWWLGEIRVAEVYVLGYRSRSEARQVEASMIHDQHPVYNTSRESGSYLRYRANQSRSDELGDDYMRPVNKRYFIGKEEQWRKTTDSTPGLTSRWTNTPR